MKKKNLPFGWTNERSRFIQSLNKGGMMDSTLYLSNKEYLIVLKRVREKIANRVTEARGYDDTTMGSKNTECNVGLCEDDPKIYTKEMNLWPDQYPARVSPKYTRDKQYCPLSKGHKTNGCFYSCLFFKDGLTDKKKILELYDERIAEVESKIKKGGNHERQQHNHQKAVRSG